MAFGKEELQGRNSCLQETSYFSGTGMQFPSSLATILYVKVIILALNCEITLYEVIVWQQKSLVSTALLTYTRAGEK